MCLNSIHLLNKTFLDLYFTFLKIDWISRCYNLSLVCNTYFQTKRQNSLLRDVLNKVSVQSTPNVQTDKKKTQLNVPKHERKTSVTGAKVRFYK